MINGSRMATRGILGVFSIPVRLFSNAGWKGKMFMVAIVGVFMTVGMISANSTASKTAGVEQKMYEQSVKEAKHWEDTAPKVVPNSKCQTTTTTSTTTGKNAHVVHTTKKVCK